MTRQDPAKGKDSPPFGQESDRASLDDMLQGYTISNARAMALDSITGSIEVGKAADLIILPQDIHTIDTYDIHNLSPDIVYIDGKQAYPQQ